MSLESRLPEIIRSLQQGASRVNEASAKKIERDAYGRIPKRTGDTAKTIQARHVEGDDWEVVVGFPGQFIERGTRSVGARPFMVPAAEAEREHHARAIRDLLE